MKRIRFAFCTLLLALLLTGCGGSTVKNTDTQSGSAAAGSAETQEAVPSAENRNDTDTQTDSKILVAYFSATGHTKPIAETVAELTGADLFEIVPAEAYTDEDLDYTKDDCRANREQKDAAARPEISGSVSNMEQYDIVFLAHPIWWGEEPRILDTFVESYDLSGKTVVNFCTSGGSGVAASTENLKALAPDANWLEGHRFETGASADTVQAWLDELDLPNQEAS